MRLPKGAILVILALLFLSAIGARVATTSRLDSPYFKGASAMNHRHATAVAGGVPLRALDAQANHPQGYVPARVAPQGSELALGWIMRAAAFVSDADARTVTRHFVVIVSALCVFTMFGIARRLWDCQAAGLLAAALTAFLPPLVAASNGRGYSHAEIAALVGSLHALLVLHATTAATRARTIIGALAAAAAAYALFAVWEGAGVVVVVGMAGLALWRRTSMRARITLLAAHALAAVAAVATLPHLTSGESFPTFAYLATRLRFLVEKPADAAMLSERMRQVWSLDHAPLAPQFAIQLLVPLALCGAALLLSREARARRRTLTAAGAVALLAALVALLDRGALPVAVMAMIPVLVGGARGAGNDWRGRMPLLILAGYCVFAGVAFRQKGPDAAYQLASAMGVAHKDPDAFLWVSLENTDRELVRFVSSRTSVRDVIFAPEDLSALLLTFTGRNQVLLPGGTSPAAAAKHVALARGLYGGEEEFHRACRELGIGYVVYSIDALLDPGRYSPRYLAGLESLTSGSLAFQMHFAPESLRYFMLQYQNDHYRLFKVTDGPETIFLTDHPPVYQPELLRASGGDLAAFQRNIANLIYNYVAGVDARSLGDAEGALRKLRSCVNAAPRFTRAQLALADVYLDLERFEEARGVIMRVVSYAPDNPEAMYYAAYVNARLGRNDEAKAYLEILLTLQRDPDVVDRARLLEAYMDQGLPLEPGAPGRQPKSDRGD